MNGRLLGIARHARPGAPIATIDAAEVTLEGGIAGDHRGGMKRAPHKRQVTLFELGDWQAATAEVGCDAPWPARRCNLLVDCDLPQVARARVYIGADVVLEITGECDPCVRMDAVAPGLYRALIPDWRGGACAKVVAGGRIAAGDEIRIEEPWADHSERSTTSAMSRASGSSSARI